MSLLSKLTDMLCVLNVQRLGANAAGHSKGLKRETEYSCRGRYDAEEGEAARSHLSCAVVVAAAAISRKLSSSPKTRSCTLFFCGVEALPSPATRRTTAVALPFPSSPVHERRLSQKVSSDTAARPFGPRPVGVVTLGHYYSAVGLGLTAAVSNQAPPRPGRLRADPRFSSLEVSSRNLHAYCCSPIIWMCERLTNTSCVLFVCVSLTRCIQRPPPRRRGKGPMLPEYATTVVLVLSCAVGSGNAFTGPISSSPRPRSGPKGGSKRERGRGYS